MNYTSNIRKVVKTILPTKFAYGVFEKITLIAVKYYEKQFSQKILLRRDTSDYRVFAEIFLFRDYNYNLPLSPKTIVDAGANVGYASLWFHHKFPDVNIIAIEPEESNFDLLTSNTSKIKNIQCIKKGLWPKSTNLEIINEDGSKYGFITREISAKNKDSIETCTMLEITKLFNNMGLEFIDILKIDIEGAEKELFSENVENWIDKVKVIILELHENIRPGCTDVVLSSLQKHHFELIIERGENLVYVNRSLIE